MTTAVIQGLIDSLGEAQGPARELAIRSLLARAHKRIKQLANAILHKSYPRLVRPPLQLETDELVDGVVVRLFTALASVQPQEVRQFFALVNKHIRWELLTLVGELDRRERTIDNPPDLPEPDSGSSTPSLLWVRLLEEIEKLPDREREVVDLIFSEGLTHAEAAERLGVAEKTVQRDWTRIQMALSNSLGEFFPDV